MTVNYVHLMLNNIKIIFRVFGRLCSQYNKPLKNLIVTEYNLHSPNVNNCQHFGEYILVFNDNQVHNCIFIFLPIMQ